MREIKFRAWIRGKMQYEFLPTGLGVLLMDRKPEISVMQYAGLKDKNGKEIYEGDVIEIELDWGKPKSCKAIVEFEYGRFCGKAIRQHDIVGKGNRWLTINLTEDHNGCEVIGNIWENPDLLNS